MYRQVLVICLALGCQDEQLKRERDEAVKAREVAEQQAAEAVKSAREAQETVEKLERELDELVKRVDDAVAALGAAQTDADRSAAKSKLETLKKEHAEAMQKAAAAKAAAKKAGR